MTARPKEGNRDKLVNTILHHMLLHCNVYALLVKSDIQTVQST